MRTRLSKSAEGSTAMLSRMFSRLFRVRTRLPRDEAVRLHAEHWPSKCRAVTGYVCAIVVVDIQFGRRVTGGVRVARNSSAVARRALPAKFMHILITTDSRSRLPLPMKPSPRDATGTRTARVALAAARSDLYGHRDRIHVTPARRSKMALFQSEFLIYDAIVSIAGRFVIRPASRSPFWQSARAPATLANTP
ncbi:unnamed protein product, partial [Iphiclides podalirius]